MPTEITVTSSEFDTIYTVRAGFWVVAYIIYLAICVLLVVSFWKIFEKAWKPGWAAIIPFYNIYVLYEIVWWNGWNVLWYLIPPVWAIMTIIAYFKLSVKFGKSAWYWLFILFFSIIALPIMAFDNSKYNSKA